MIENTGSTHSPAQKVAASSDAALVEEYAVAIAINSIKYTVMMASPYELEHFVIGFLLSEQIIQFRYDIHDISLDIDSNNFTALVDVSVANRITKGLKDKKRSVNSNSSCGICGVEAIAQALPKLTPLSLTPALSVAVIEQSINQLGHWQLLAKKSGALHAAALINLKGELNGERNGEIVACAEDVGRHNALDKTIGYLVNKQLIASDHALLVTSRCSVELVHKAIIARVPHLLCLASPSQLAVKVAQDNHLNLVHVRKHDDPIYY